MGLTRRQLLASTGGGAILGAASYDAVVGDQAGPSTASTAVDATAGETTTAAIAAADVDVFLIGGQSNATGHGNSEESPQPPPGTAFEYVPHGGLEPLADPVGEARSGSAWPAFAERYWTMSGRHAVYVSASIGGTSVHPAANDNWWSQSGLLLYRAIGRLRSAIVNLKLAEITPNFGGMLWHQGETDAGAIDNEIIDPVDFRQAFETIIARYRQEVDDPQAPFYLFQLGRRSDGDTAGFQHVRRIQREVAASDPNAWLVFDDAVSFPESGKMGDRLHYNQDGLNEMGTGGGQRVAEIQGE